MKKERAIVFIDGNNFYHGMRSLRLPSADLHYDKFSEKLTQERQWLETRYYIGRVRQEGDLTRYANQRKFFLKLEQFNRVRYFCGRVEARPADRAAKRLSRWLNALPRRTDISVSGKVISELQTLVDNMSVQYVEKAVDVMIATDMVAMAHKNEYDVAYLLSADGDFTPAVQAVQDLGCKVFVASPEQGAQISAAAYKFIPLTRESFHGCWE